MPRPSTRRSTGLAAALCGLLLPTVLPAATYRWVDETGVTVYSQLPPTGAEAQRLDTGAPPTRSPAPPPGPAQSVKTEPPASPGPTTTEDGGKGPKKGKQTAVDKAKEKEIRKENCEAARSNLDNLQNLGTRRLRLPDGTYERPTEEQLKQRIHDTREQVKEFCK